MYNLEWKRISQAKPFGPGSGVCRLCIREKYVITFKPHMSTINYRCEIAGPCLHKANRLIGKSLIFIAIKWLWTKQISNPEENIEPHM